MLKIILMRHCTTDWAIEKRFQGNTDTSLNEKGRLHASEIGKNFKNFYKISEIYSSGLLRSYETAKIISEYLNLPVQKIYELNERSFGDWEGLTYNEIEKKYNVEEYIKDPINFSIPNAESFNEFKERVLKGINFILKKHKEKIHKDTSETILVVGHGGTNRIILCYALNIDYKNFFSINQDFGCINIIEDYGGKFFIELINGKI